MIPFEYQLYGSHINRTDTVKYLTIILDHHHQWHDIGFS
jgi:hypothetical protein